MEINFGQLAILIGAGLVCCGLATWGAVKATKGLIAMKKSGEYDKIAQEFKTKSFRQIIGLSPKRTKTSTVTDTVKVTK